MKMKKITTLILAAAMALSLAACGTKETPTTPSVPATPPASTAPASTTPAAPAAEADHVYENGGLKLTVPAAYDALVNVETTDDTLFYVAEKASVEAAAKQGETGRGPGMLFELSRVSEAELNEYRSYDIPGFEALAVDGNGDYLVLTYPTDVRIVRENYESLSDENSEDAKNWAALNEWARTQARSDLLALNSGLTAVSYGCTDVDVYLARAAYAPDTNYLLSTLEYGQLEPLSVDPAPYVERLTRNVTYTMLENAQAPDGEYAVISFPDEGRRFDFFFALGNIVRETWEDGTEVFYEATFPDGTTKASEIVREWCEQIADVNFISNNTLMSSAENMVGRWAESEVGRGVITITKVNDSTYDVLVEWANGAAETYVWKMTGTTVGDGAELSYKDCVHTIVTYDANGSASEAVQYENGTGRLFIDRAGGLEWQDDSEGAGDGCVFLFVD